MTSLQRVSLCSALIMSGFLSILFAFMKMLDLIDWSWWLITAPAWVGVIFALLFLFSMWVFSDDPAVDLQIDHGTWLKIQEELKKHGYPIPEDTQDGS